MNYIESINKKRNVIIPHLEIWFESFNPDNMMISPLDIDTIEEYEKDHAYLLNILERFKMNKCEKEDYDVILFHIQEQINYEETIIEL